MSTLGCGPNTKIKSFCFKKTDHEIKIDHYSVFLTVKHRKLVFSTNNLAMCQEKHKRNVWMKGQLKIRFP